MCMFCGKDEHEIEEETISLSERQALMKILNIAYGRIKHINHHARLLHIIEVAEDTLKEY